MIKNLLLLTVFLFSFSVFSQNQKLIVGKITVNNGGASGVVVLNMVTEKEVVSDFEGNFKLECSVDDLLVFTKNSLDIIRRVIDDKDIKFGKIDVEMRSKITQLEEVKIVNITAVSAGILSKPAASYTPAERKLQTATRLHPSLSTSGLMAGGSIGLDPLLNAISGRTKMLKRYVANEKVQILVYKLSNMFSNEYFVKNLKIESDYVRGFHFYAVENNNLAGAIRSKNPTLVSFWLSILAVDFKKMQSLEN